MARILIIDDEFEVRSTMRFMLEREGHDVVEALVNLEDIPTEIITLGEIYEEFSSGRRGVYRSTPHT